MAHLEPSKIPPLSLLVLLLAPSPSSLSPYLATSSFTLLLLVLLVHFPPFLFSSSSFYIGLYKNGIGFIKWVLSEIGIRLNRTSVLLVKIGSSSRARKWDVLKINTVVFQLLETDSSYKLKTKRNARHFISTNFIPWSITRPLVSFQF